MQRDSDDGDDDDDDDDNDDGGSMLSLSSPAAFAAMGVVGLLFLCGSLALYRNCRSGKRDMHEDAHRILGDLGGQGQGLQGHHEVQMMTTSPLQSMQSGDFDDASIRF